MSIENKIREIAKEKFNGYSYVFGDWYEVAEMLDRVPLPAIAFILPRGGTISFTRSGVKNSEDLLLAFVDKVVRDANGEDNEEVYTRMKKTAVVFVNEMNNSRYFEPIGENIKYTTVLEKASSYYTGIILELEVQERSGTCL